MRCVNSWACCTEDLYDAAAWKVVMDSDYSETGIRLHLQVSRNIPRFLGVMKVNEAQYTSLRSPQQVDADDGLGFDRMQRWLRTCKTQHQHVLRECFTRYQTPIDITLIDVEQDCLVKRSTSVSYLALSYVWGNMSNFQATTEHQEVLKQPGGLKAFPVGRLIVDTMEMVRRLGERYLWVDALCIEQDNESQKQAQINLIDAIYGQALAAIVALAADSVHSGLPGLSQPLVQRQGEKLRSGRYGSVWPDSMLATPTIPPPHLVDVNGTETFDVLYFEADVIRVDDLTPQRSGLALPRPPSWGNGIDLEYVILSWHYSQCNLMLIRWSGDYAERVGLFSYRLQ